MKIYGIQKLTLIDFPGKMACTMFTGGCNFRCPFCHNAPLVTELTIGDQGAMEEDEALAFLKKRQGILDGVCITGGEPLLQPDIEEFIKKVRALGYMVKLDTNGSYPKRLKSLVNQGLVEYVAMDIKNSPEDYGRTIGLEAFDIAPIQESIDFLKSGAVDYEFRTTVVQEFHKAENFASIGQWIQGDSKYFLQNFKDSGNVIEEGLTGFSKAEMSWILGIMKPYLPNSQLREIG